MTGSRTSKSDSRNCIIPIDTPTGGRARELHLIRSIGPNVRILDVQSGLVGGYGGDSRQSIAGNVAILYGGEAVLDIHARVTARDSPAAFVSLHGSGVARSVANHVRLRQRRHAPVAPDVYSRGSAGVHVAIVNGRHGPVDDYQAPSAEGHDVAIRKVGGGRHGGMFDAKGPAVPSECPLHLNGRVSVPYVGALAIVDNLQSTNVQCSLPYAYHRLVLATGLETQERRGTTLEARALEGGAIFRLVAIVIIVIAWGGR